MKTTGDYIIIAKSSIDAFVDKAKQEMGEESIEFTLVEAFAKWMYDNDTSNEARIILTLPPQGQNAEIERQIELAKKKKHHYVKKHDWENAVAWRELEKDLEQKLKDKK